MLKEIRCLAFSDKIKDKTIHFSTGLNCVVGADDGLNSIGKSNLLMIIDFCFGGTDYVSKGSDVLKNVGEHAVDFAFSFGSRIFYFQRLTSDPGNYFECDKFYNHVGDKKPLDELCSFLKEHYFSSLVTSSFRKLVNVFSRVYGKDNADLKRPLKTYDADKKDDNGIKVLVDLFEKMGPLNDSLHRIENMKNEKKAFDSAKRFGIVYSPIKTKNDVKGIREEIAVIKEELQDLIETEDQAALAVDVSLSQEDIDLKSEQIYLMRRRNSLFAEQRGLESMGGGNLLMTEEDREKLIAIFPNANIRPISEVNEFQKALSANVNEEIELRKVEINDEIVEISLRLREINNTLKSHNVSPRISKTFLETYRDKCENLSRLEKILERYESVSRLQDAIKEETRKLNFDNANILADVENAVNDKLVELNNKIYKEKRMPPRLSLTDFSHYSYETLNDTGTGTNFKSLLIFDLAVLELTELPFIINDSFLFTNIWDEPTQGLFQLYENAKKQIFLAIDRVSSFEESVQKIIRGHQVIKLGAGSNSLYGFDWSRSFD